MALANDSSIEQEQLQQEVELLMMEAEQMDEFQPDYFEDYATTTNVAEHMCSPCMLTLPKLLCHFSLYLRNRPRG